MATNKRQRKKSGRQAALQAEAAARHRQSRRRAVIITVVVVVIAGVLAAVFGAFSGGGSSKNVASTGSSTTQVPPSTVKGASITGDTPCPKPDGSSERTTSFAKPPPMCIDAAKTYTATMQTSQGGPITIALDAKAAPKTVNNFVVLARYHFYDGLTFHRILPDFVIQGGDPQGTGSGGPGYQFADELPQAGQYKPGSLAMANSGPNTNGSQFFIVLSDNGAKQLQPLYSLFGQVTAGMDVVNRIAALGDPNAPNGEPKQRVTITSVTIEES